MNTILGAGGAIAEALVGELAAAGKPVRLVSRHPTLLAGATETLAADVSDPDQTNRAVWGTEVVYLLVGLKYDTAVWAEYWPQIMHNAIEACKRANARLVFFDNVYMYGRVEGVMTEETHFNPCSRKGEIRARIAAYLLDEIQAGRVKALIARSADFYGPNPKNSVANILVFDKLANGAKAQCLASDRTRHSNTFAPDAARSLVMLAESDEAFGQTWHVPTAPSPPTGAEFVELAARAFGVEPRHRVLGRVSIRLAGLFDRTTRELYEMLYQNEHDYLFDSTKFDTTFAFAPTSYEEGVRITAAAYAKGRA